MRPAEREAIYGEIDERMTSQDFDPIVMPTGDEAWLERIEMALDEAKDCEEEAHPHYRRMLHNLAAEVIGAIAAHDRARAAQ